MSADTRAPTARRSSFTLLVVLGATLAYTIAALGEYAATPLGRVALLDSRENLELARQIAEASLPAEPFYRAPLYAGLLALLLDLGWPEHALADGARLVNALAHLLATAVVHGTAGRLWRDRRAAALGAVLFGGYPLALHFAGDVQDTTVGVLLFVCALHAIVRSHDECATPRARIGWHAAAGIALGLATAARPHYAAALAGWLGHGTWLALRGGIDRRTVLPGLAGAALPLLALGIANVAVSGRFAILPSQGAYALWTANGPGANGRYYAQSSATGERADRVNPARFESERLYREATGRDARADPRAYERYWRERTLAYVAREPLASAALLARKTYFLLHDFEQYNTRTYHFHKARQRALRFNPLGWGVLVLLAAYAWLRTAPARDPARRALLVVAFAYGVGVLVYFVGDRFRYPLVPVVAMLAAGVVATPRRPFGARTAAGLAVTAIVVFWPLPASMRDETVVADWLLLAEADNELGDYGAARAAIAEVLARQPGEPRALASACVLHYNEYVGGFDGAPPERDRIDAALAACALAPGLRARHHEAIWLHAAGRRGEALSTWGRLADARGGAHDEAGATLLALGASEAPPPSSWDDVSGPYVEAYALRGNAAACAELERRWRRPPARRVAAMAALLGVASGSCDARRRVPAE